LETEHDNKKKLIRKEAVPDVLIISESLILERIEDEDGFHIS
jgi:hypothetical protein